MKKILLAIALLLSVVSTVHAASGVVTSKYSRQASCVYVARGIKQCAGPRYYLVIKQPTGKLITRSVSASRYNSTPVGSRVN